MKKLNFILCFILVILNCAFISSGCLKDSKTTEYQIECSLDGYKLTGKQKVSFYNHSELVFNELKFNLFANAFRKGAKYSPIATQYLDKAYPNGENFGQMTIDTVSVCNQNVDYKICGQDENILSVPLNQELFPNERVEIYIEFTLNLANVIARTGYNDDTINLANFYPILCGIDDNGFYECVYYSTGDPFFSDVSKYLVSFTCDSNYKVASSGKVLTVKTEQAKTCYQFELECGRDFAMVLSKKFNVVTHKMENTEINYYYYNDQTPSQSLDYAIKAITLFEQKFGEFPYESLAVVQTQFIQGGMEFPALVMISDDLTGLSYGEVIVHETAHQWWQSAVGNNEVEHSFLDEGLCEYSVIIFYENYPEYGYTRQSLIKASENTYKVFCSVYDKVFKHVNTVMLRGLKDFTSEYEYVNIAYIKPCIMFDTLRTTIGEQRFFNALRRYYNEYKFKNAIPDDMVGAFEKCGADSNGFFESFFNGKVIV